MQFSLITAVTLLAIAEGTVAAGLISGAARAAPRIAKGAAEAGAQAAASSGGNNNNNNGKRDNTPQQWEAQMTDCIHEYHQTPAFSMHSDGADKVTLVNVGPKCMSFAHAYASDPHSASLDPVFGKLNVLSTNTLQLTNIPASYQKEVQDAIAAEKAAAGQQ